VQEPVLFARSVHRNIALGLEAADGTASEPTRAQVVAAAQSANAHDFIMALPQGAHLKIVSMFEDSLFVR
jgi:ABC-type multidrug transport system fused ATPase/permease subunit